MKKILFLISICAIICFACDKLCFSNKIGRILKKWQYYVFTYGGCCGFIVLSNCFEKDSWKANVFFAISVCWLVTFNGYKEKKVN